MDAWQILPPPNLGKFVEPDEFRAVRNPRGNGRSLVRDIWQRFPNQPPMPMTHPAMQGDAAMFSGRKPVTMMHPIDGQYFPYALKLSQKINAAKRANVMHENELARGADHEARAIALEQEHLTYRTETGAMQRFAQSAMIKGARFEAMEKMAVARALRQEATAAAANSGKTSTKMAEKISAPLDTLRSAETPVGIELPVLLASQAANAASLGMAAYQGAAQIKNSPQVLGAEMQIQNVLGTVQAIPNIAIKV